jgi:hypothetical protein
LTIILPVNGSLTVDNMLPLIETAGSENPSRCTGNLAWLEDF